MNEREVFPAGPETEEVFGATEVVEQTREQEEEGQECFFLHEKIRWLTQHLAALVAGGAIGTSVSAFGAPALERYLDRRDDKHLAEGYFRDHPATETEQRELDAMAKTIRVTFGDGVWREILLEQREHDRIEHRGEAAPRYGTINGFLLQEDESDVPNVRVLEEVTMDPVTLQEFTEGGTPKGWVREEVAWLGGQSGKKDLPAEYGLGKEWPMIAMCSGSADGDTITFYETDKALEFEYLLNTILMHELGHANDWRSDASLSLTERAALLLAVHRRLAAPDRLLSTYVESIRNEDPQREHHRKALEYWAEICSRYFGAPHDLHYEDFQLVDRVVRKADPHFSLADSQRHRRAALQRFSEEHQ